LGLSLQILDFTFLDKNFLTRRFANNFHHERPVFVISSVFCQKRNLFEPTS